MVGIVVILLTVRLSGCNENEPEYSIVGTWTDRESSSNQVIFREEGNFVITGAFTDDGTYTINGNVIKLDFSDDIVSFEYKFLSKDVLLLTDEDGVEKTFDRT